MQGPKHCRPHERACGGTPCSLVPQLTHSPGTECRCSGMEWPTDGVTLMMDGATKTDEKRWGVGICASTPQTDLEVYMGGSMDAIKLPDDPAFVDKRLSNEVAEAAAVWVALRFGRKLIENRAKSASQDRCNITLVTDRPATMVSLQHMLLNCCKAYKCDEFEAILRHMSHGFAKLCKVAGGEVIVRWKGDLEHLRRLTPKEWPPDRLARLGSQKGREILRLEWDPPCHHIAIQLSRHPLNNSLMTKASVSLRRPIQPAAPGRETHGHSLHLHHGHEDFPDDGGTIEERLDQRRLALGYTAAW